MRRATRRSSADVASALRAVADHLRAGRSLRDAVIESAGIPGSPLVPIAGALRAGRPLREALTEAALTSAPAPGPGDPDLRSALCLLAVHAETGGDPLPACSKLVAAATRQGQAVAEARALTTQARLGARAVMGLTPAFLLLLVLTDPGGAGRWLAQPAARAAVAAGLGLQALGALWIAAIVRRATSGGGGGTVPVLRAVAAVAVGRPRDGVEGEVAALAETMAFALEAGLSPSAALRLAAPLVRGEFGDVARKAAASPLPSHLALAGAASGLQREAVSRFVRAYAASIELGVPLAPALRDLADDVHRRRSTDLAEDVRRASVRVLAPLAFLVLPAFVLACLVPLLTGGLRGLAG